MKTFLILNNDFQVQYLASAHITDDNTKIVMHESSLPFLAVSQLVQIAKSLNPEAGVNIKKSREVILEVIKNELKNQEVREPVLPPKAITKDICWAAFAKIDMNDKQVARELIDKLVTKHKFIKSVVQSYASDYRKMHAA